jgi:hypothetical protein
VRRKWLSSLASLSTDDGDSFYSAKTVPFTLDPFPETCESFLTASGSLTSHGLNDFVPELFTDYTTLMFSKPFHVTNAVAFQALLDEASTPSVVTRDLGGGVAALDITLTGSSINVHKVRFVSSTNMNLSSSAPTDLFINTRHELLYYSQDCAANVTWSGEEVFFTGGLPRAQSQHSVC